MSSINNHPEENSWNFYLSLGAAAISAGLGLYVYIKSKFQKTPLMQRVETIAEPSFRSSPPARAVEPPKSQRAAFPVPAPSSAVDPSIADIVGLLPREALESPKILQAPMTLRGFIDHHYSGGTENADFHIRRLEAVSQFYSLTAFIPVRGDGNCFANAAAAGLLNKLAKDPAFKGELISTIQAYQESPNIYVKQDPTAQEQHYRNFHKAGDFALVLNALAKRTPHDLFQDDAFTAAFTRILRYVLTHVSPSDAVTPRCGEEMDNTAVWDLNKIFNLNVKVAIIEGTTPADSKGPHACIVSEGKDCNQHIQDLSRGRQAADFVILRKSGHFVCGF